MAQRICLTLEYDGTDYQGWQRQEGLASVQSSLELALARITHEPPEALKLSCAGRTDAGVHAMGQLCSFVTTDGREAQRFAPALNHFLPRSIRVHLARAVGMDFDVRRISEAKWYQYQIYVGMHASALLQKRAWHVRRRLDATAMQTAAQALCGEHDFESFRSAHCDAAHARRHMHAIRVGSHAHAPLGTRIEVDLFGNAFCRHMCRILVGTLVEVGYGLRTPAQIPALLAARDRKVTGVTAPPHGLTLRQIYLPGDCHMRPWQAPGSVEPSQQALA